MDEPRRLRGLVRISLTAGTVMSVVAAGSLGLALVTGAVPGSVFDVIELAIRGFVAGAVAGGLFSWFVIRRERGQNLSSLSTRRVAIWGALATGSVPLIVGLELMARGRPLPLGVLASGTLLYGVGGALFSAGMLRLARRTPHQLPQPDSLGDRALPQRVVGVRSLSESPTMIPADRAVCRGKVTLRRDHAADDRFLGLPAAHTELAFHVER